MIKQLSNQNKANWKDHAKAIIIIAGVIAVGMLAINQTLGFIYKAHFLKSPCDLCGQLNPEVESCIINLNKEARYWTQDGWKNESNVNENFKIKNYSFINQS